MSPETPWYSQSWALPGYPPDTWEESWCNTTRSPAVWPGSPWMKTSPCLDLIGASTASIRYEEWVNADGRIVRIPHLHTGVPSPHSPWHGRGAYLDDSNEPCELHEDLEVSALEWDILDPPSSAWRVHRKSKKRSTPEYDALAAPYASNITIHLDHPQLAGWAHLWGPIQVYKKTECGEITVREVLEAVYHYFHQPLGWKEFWRTTDGERRGVRKAYSRRSRTRNLGCGVQRVDVLSEWTQFVGLRLMKVHGENASLGLILGR